jgi:hypothetical protein
VDDALSGTKMTPGKGPLRAHEIHRKSFVPKGRGKSEVVIAGPTAEILGPSPVELRLETGAFRGFRRLCGSPRLRALSRLADQGCQPGESVQSVALTGTEAAGFDEKLSPCRETAAGKADQAPPHSLGEGGRAFDIETQLDGRGGLVDLLASRT